jgi:hypothetical protein
VASVHPCVVIIRMCLCGLEYNMEFGVQGDGLRGLRQEELAMGPEERGFGVTWERGREYHVEKTEVVGRGEVALL